MPVDYEAFSGDASTQIGTGAYKLKSFTPGQESVHERNPNYWRSGQPYFDTVTITDFSDATAQVNAPARWPDRRDDRRPGRAGGDRGGARASRS